MQTERDAKFVLAAVEGEPVDFLEESAPENRQADTPGDIVVTSPLVTSISPAPSDMPVTSPGDIHVTPLVTPMSPKENNKKRINNRGKVPVTFSSTSPSKVSFHGFAAPKDLVGHNENHPRTPSCRIADGNRKPRPSAAITTVREQLHAELVDHQTKLGFTPDDPPPKPKASREEESCEPATLSDWPSPEEVRATFNEARRSMGWPIKR